jgi:ABC-type Fe3+-hydroxamate transport system substrate-binding protein
MSEENNSFTKKNLRIVSLVPSITETMFDLGFEKSVVAATDFCIYPIEKVESLPRVGGPKNINIEKIMELKPDIVLANQEENSKADIIRMKQLGLTVWMSFPKTVREMFDDLRQLISIEPTEKRFLIVDSLERSWEKTRQVEMLLSNQRYFCPVWIHQPDGNLQWWMTFNGETYSSDLLNGFGLENIFSDRIRRYPLAADLGLGHPEEAGERDTRYPRVTSDEISALDPELIILPSEPYPFSETDVELIRKELTETTAVHENRICHVDGTCLFWPGTRLAKAISIIPKTLKTSY